MCADVLSRIPPLHQASVLRITDVVVGSTVEGIVESVAGSDEDGDAGKKSGHGASPEVDFAAGKGVLAVVRLSDSVKAIVTAIHAADVLPKQAFASTKARKAFLRGAGLHVGAKVSQPCAGGTFILQGSLRLFFLTSSAD